jgi:hypothetical protein
LQAKGNSFRECGYNFRPGFYARGRDAPDLLNFQLAIFPSLGKISLARSMGLLNTQPPGRAGLNATR